MAASVAQNVQFKLGTVAVPATVTDRSTYFDSVEFPQEADAVETTAFGNNGNRTFIPGLKGRTFSASGWYDATIDAHLWGIYDGQTVIAFEYGPINGSSPNPKYTGDCFVSNYEIGAAVGEKIPFSLEVQITSTVTRTTYV